MHELSVTENILAIAIAHAEQNGADQVSAIYLVIGEFSAIFSKCIQYYWNILVRDIWKNLYFILIIGRYLPRENCTMKT